VYDFIDRPITDLNHGGRVLIWSMRSWVKAMGERTCPASVVASAFARWNMLPGLQPFLRAMALFNRHGLENFQFCPLQCNHVSEHEAIIVSLLRALREERPEAVRTTLALLVEEEALGDLIVSLTRLGETMVAAGVFPDRIAARQAPSASNPATRLQ